MWFGLNGVVGDSNGPQIQPSTPHVVPRTSSGDVSTVGTSIPAPVWSWVWSILPSILPIGSIANQLEALALLMPQFLIVCTLRMIPESRSGTHHSIECCHLRRVFHLYSPGHILLSLFSEKHWIDFVQVREWLNTQSVGSHNPKLVRVQTHEELMHSFWLLVPKQAKNLYTFTVQHLQVCIEVIPQGFYSCKVGTYTRRSLIYECNFSS